MPSVYNFKPAFQRLLRPAVRWLARRTVSANKVTVAAIIISAIQGICIAWQPSVSWPFVLMPVTLLIRMALNAIDGILAREHDSASDLGFVLNELGDLISDIALYLPLALVPGVSSPLIVMIVCLALVSEATGIIASQISGTRGNEGPMGKSDRALLFGAFAFALGVQVPMGAWVNGLLLLTILLLLLTVVNRVSSALQRAKRTQGKRTPGVDELLASDCDELQLAE